MQEVSTNVIAHCSLWGAAPMEASWLQRQEKIGTGCPQVSVLWKHKNNSSKKKTTPKKNQPKNKRIQESHLCEEWLRLDLFLQILLKPTTFVYLKRYPQNNQSLFPKYQMSCSWKILLRTIDIFITYLFYCITCILLGSCMVEKEEIRRLWQKRKTKLLVLQEGKKKGSIFSMTMFKIQ